ncbi:MAG: hypothetical protein ACR2PL_03645 [Dehalococcoidia bacterium]
MSEIAPRPRYAPNVPIVWIVRLYQSDALGIRDEEQVDKVGWRLHARCSDVLLVSDSMVKCPVCQTEFVVSWIGQPEDRLSTCPTCGWSISAGAYHAGFEHQDLLGGNAREAFADFAEGFPAARGYVEKMLLIDRVVHALHRSGNVAARNLLEGHARQVLATLDALAGRGDSASVEAEPERADHQ